MYGSYKYRGIITLIITIISFFQNQLGEVFYLIIISGAISIYKFYKYHQTQRIKNDDGINTISYKAKIENLEINGPITSIYNHSVAPYYALKIKFYDTNNILQSYKLQLLEKIIPQEVVNIIIDKSKEEEIQILKNRIINEYNNELVIKEQVSNQNRYIVDPLEKYKGTKNSLTMMRNKETIVMLGFGIILLIIIGILYWLFGVNLS